LRFGKRFIIYDFREKFIIAEGMKLILCFLFLNLFPNQSDQISPHDLTNQVCVRSREIKSLIYTLRKTERFAGVMMEQQSFVKLALDPFRIYMKQMGPTDGLEILYVSGTNNNKALINPNGFPWFNLSLDPYGKIMRRNQHHTIFHSGFDYVVSILELLSNKYKSNIDSMITIQGSIDWQGNDCYKLVLDNPHFKYIDYIIREGETLLSIADKYKISEHMIMDRNRDIDFYDDFHVGQLIQIPNDYAAKMVLYLDKERMIPIVMMVYDDEGLYEKFEYLSIELNPKIPAEEFSEDFEDYGY